MSKTAFIFPGQGSQTVGMGVAVADAYPVARSLFDRASETLGFDLFVVCKEGPEDRLRQTNIAQPALYVSGVAAAEVLRTHGVAPDAVAGHSIGEYAALAVSGAFSFDEGLKLVRERGRLMHEAGVSRPGAMSAILGLSADQISAICAEAAQGQICAPVNFNSPEQIVVAGENSAMDRFNALAPTRGAKRVIPLSVSGAFHSPLMKDAALAMRGILEKVVFEDASTPVAMNVDGVLRHAAGDIRSALAKQLDSPVVWVKTIETLREAGCTRFVETGAGRVLSGLLRRIDRQLQSFSTDTVEAVAEAIGGLSLSGRENA